MKTMFKMLQAAVPVLASVASMGTLYAQPAICLEQPYVWMTFNNPESVHAHYGQVAPSFNFANGTYVAFADGIGGAIKSATSYTGAAVAATTTDLTVIHRFKVEKGAKKILFCFGSHTATTVQIDYLTKADGTLRLQALTTVNAAVDTTKNGLDIVPPAGVDLTADFHEYAFTYNQQSKLVKVYLDGAYQGEFTSPLALCNGQKFQLFATAGGLGSTGLTSSTVAELDDFKVYQRILTDEEMANLRVGRTVPVYGQFVAATEKKIWPNTQLKDLYRYRAFRGGAADSKAPALTLFPEFSSTAGYAQFELYPETEKVHEKVVRVDFRQEGGDVYATAVGCSYINWYPDPKNGSTNLGHDFRPLVGKIAGLKNAGQLVEANENSTLASSVGNGNYGVMLLTADKLTDDGAAVRDAEGWLAAREPAAGTPISFRTGSGTWVNPTADAAYGTLAFGCESGAWTIGGERATFAEIVNASAHRQTIEFAITNAAAAVFSPEVGNAGMTFAGLDLAGTFYPVGGGGAVHTGTTRIGTYNTRLGLSVIKRPAAYPSNRDAWTNMVNIARIVTAPGSQTTIETILPNMATFNDSVLLIEGDTTVGSIELPNDTYLVITNGTTTFRNGVDTKANTQRWVNGFIAVHTDAVLNLPSFATYGRVKFFVDGRLVSNRFAMPANLQGHWMQGAGMIVLAGDGIVASAPQTINYGLKDLIPNATLLPIQADLNFVTDPLRYAGPIFIHTATEAGIPATVVQSGAFTPNTEDIRIVGGGTFRTDSTAAAQFYGSLTVGDNTTADFSTASSFSATNLTLGAGAELRIPYTAGTPLVKGSLSLPATGSVLLRLTPDANFAAGDFALAAPEVTVDAAMASKLNVSLSGSAGSVYTASVVYEEGALKLRVAKEETAMSAEISFPGYTGLTTLTDFPVQIRLPECVSGFTYSSMHDGTSANEIYFTDENGNTLAHEVEVWRKNNADLDGSLIWVKVPSFNASAKVVMHWGTEKPANRTVAATSVWSAFAGVWHMNSAKGSTATVEPDATGNGVNGTPKGNHLSELAPELSTLKGMGYTVRNMTTADQNSNRLEMPNGYTSRIANMANITVGGWFNRANLSGYSRAFRSKNGSNVNGFEVELDAGQSNVIKVRGSNSNAYIPTIDNFYNNWVYLVIVYEGTTAKVYSNGALKGTGGITTAVSNSGAGFALGGCLNASSKSLTGLIDEFRIASGSLSADWIKASYDTVNSVDTFSSGAAVAAGKVYDFRDKVGTFVVDFDTAGYTVYAGEDTVLTIPASGTLIVEPGMKATVREWLGSIDNRGHLKLTGSGLVTESHTTGTIEYAGIYTLGYEYVKAPTISSGTNFISGPINQWLYTSGGPFTVSGGCLTLLGQVNSGSVAALAGESKAAHLTMTGGEMVAPEGYFSIADDSVKDYEINLSGGRWTAPVKCWYSNAAVPLAKINISSDAVFAPTATGLRRDCGTIYNGAYARWRATVSDGGTFVLPDDLNGLFILSGGAVEGTLWRKSDFNLSVRFDLPTATTLALDGAAGVVYRALPAATFAGEGTLALKDGVTLDLTDYTATTNFIGTIEVRTGATLILPSASVPSFGIDVKAGGKVKGVLTTLPNETPAFLGAIRSLPEFGTATLELELPAALPLGTYNLATGVSNTEHLQVVFTGAAGATTAGNVSVGEAGSLQLAITESSNPGFALEWAPADSTATVTTDSAVLAWKRYGSDEETRYPYYAKVPLHFTDAASVKSVIFNGGIAATEIVVDAAGEYTFGGEVEVGAWSLVKLGTGRLTIGATRFATVTNVVVEAGALGFGNDAREGVLGAAEVPVQVREGATLDLADGLTASAMRGPLWNKTAVIAGEGMDGAGAIRRHGSVSLVNTYTLRKVLLAGDTLIKGDSLEYTDRMDIGRGEVDGGIIDPETNKTLTVSSAVNVHGPVVANKIDITNGLLMTETERGQIVAPAGLTLGDQAEVRSFLPAGIPVDAPVEVVGKGTAIGNNGLLLRQGMQVAEGADLTVNRIGAGTTTVMGGVTNAGTIAVKAGTLRMDGGRYTGEGSLTQSGGATVFSGAGANVAEANFAVTGGQLHFGEGAGKDMPVIGTIAGTVRNASTFIEPDAVRTVGGEFDTLFTATGASVGDVQLRPNTNALTIDGANWDLGNGRLSVGSALGAPGVFVTNSTITAYRVCLGETPYGRLTWQGGTLNVTGGSTADGFIFGYNAAMAQDECFTMEGGLLTTDKGAIRSYRPRRDGLFMNLEAGTWRPKAYRWFESYVFPFAFGDGWRRTGKEFVLDLETENIYLNFVRVGLGGSSDVRVTGAGYVWCGNANTISPYQGVAHGRWRVETTGTAENELNGIASFESGLSLATNVKARVSIEGEGIVEATMLEGAGTFAAAVATNNTSMAAMSDATANSLMMGAYRAGGSWWGSNRSMMTRGRFYVPEAGTWYFAGTFDDYLAFYIDGVQVLQTTASNEIKTGSRALTKGWHLFTITGYDGTGDQGPTQGAWKTRNMSVGWTTTATTSTDANDYEPFDNTTLMMQSEPSIRWQRATVSNATGLQEPANLRAYSEWTSDVVTNTLRIINTKQHPALQLAINRFSGYFYVESSQVGEWSFRTRFDDTDLFAIDGEEVVCNNRGGGMSDWSVGTKTLTQGFHFFEFRCVDGGGGWGGKAQGNVASDDCALLAKRPLDADYVAFDENLVQFAHNTFRTRHMGEGGILGELELGEGAVLRNTVQRGACPILGTLCGTGTLQGPFRFAGENNCWRISGASNDFEPSQFVNPDAATLAGLKRVELDFTTRPLRRRYVLADALGLTSETVGEVELTVKVNGNPLNTNALSLAIENDKLVVNNTSYGIIIYLK